MSDLAGFKVEWHNPRYLIAVWPDWRHSPVLVERDQEDGSDAPVISALEELA